MRKLFFVLCGFILLVMGGILIIPSFIDWNAYKPYINKKVRDATGRELQIAGDIKLSILPVPALKVEQVSLGNVEGAVNRDMIVFEAVDIKINIGALLNGKIAVKSVRLVRPIFSLEITETGHSSWDINSKKINDVNGIIKNSSLNKMHLAEEKLDFAISLESLMIDDGIINYLDSRTGHLEKFEQVNMKIIAKSLTGPFRADGRASRKGMPFLFKLSAGNFSDKEPLPLNLVMELIETGATARFNGSLSSPAPERTLLGKLSFSTPNLATLIWKNSGVALPSSFAQNMQMDAEISASKSEFSLNKLLFQLGNMSFAGAINSVLKPVTQIDLILSAGKLNLNKLLPTEKTKPLGKSDPIVDKAPKTKGNSKTPRTENTNFTIPDNIIANFDLNVEAAIFNKGVIRDASLRGALHKGVIAVEQMKAIFPGGSDLSLTGKLKSLNGSPEFTGTVTAKSDNLRSVAKWLGVNTSNLSTDRLRKFTYKSKLRASPKKAEITEIVMQLDAVKINAAMAFELRKKLAIKLDLAVENINLDGYLSKFDKVQNPPLLKKRKPKLTPITVEKSQNQRPAPETLNRRLERIFKTLDARVAIKAKQVSFKGETVRNAKLNLTIHDQKITIQEASVDEFAGISASTAGTIGTKNKKPNIIIDYLVDVKNLGRLARFMGVKLSLPPNRFGKISTRGHVYTDLEQLQTKFSLNCIGGQAQIKGNFTNPNANLTVFLKHSSLQSFIGAFFPKFHPATTDLGPLDLKFSIKGHSNSISLNVHQSEFGPIKIVGSGKLDLFDQMNLDLNLKTSEVPLSLFLPLTSNNAPNNDPHLVNRRIPRQSKTRRRKGPKWSSQPISLPISNSISGNINLEMASVTTNSLHLENPKLHVTLSPGNITLDKFHAILFGGEIRGRGALQTQDDNTALTTELSIERLASRSAIRMLTGLDRMQGPISINAKLAAHGNSEISFISSLTGKASLNGKVKLVLSKVERQQMEVAQVGSKILSTLFGNNIGTIKNFSPFTQLATALDHAFGRNPANLSGDIQITQGIALTENLALSNNNKSVKVSATIDLPRWKLNSKTVLIDDPNRAPLITLSTTGPLDSPSQTRIGGRLLKQGLTTIQQRSQNPLQRLIPNLLDREIINEKNQKETKGLNPRKLLDGIFKQLQR